MENKKNKCSLEQHKEIDAIIFCQICKVYMCNKCENLHLKLFPKHQIIELNKTSKEIFIEICPEKNHTILNYFCTTHNKLCCAACLSIIEDEFFGQHSNCFVFKLNDIKPYMKEGFDNNIKLLNKYYKNIQPTITELKNLYEKINKDKNDLKEKIQKIFNRLRNCLNEREDEILLKIDKQFNSYFFNEEIIKEGEKLPNKIKKTLDMGNIEDEEWNDDKNLSRIINFCIKIEKDLEIINDVSECIRKCNQKKDLKILFSPNEEGIKIFLEQIKKFGNIVIDFNKFEFFSENAERFKYNEKIKINKSDFNKFIIKEIINKTDKNGDTYQNTLKGAAILGFNNSEWGSYNLSIKKSEIERLIQFFRQTKENLSITSLELEGKKYYVIYFGKEKIYLKKKDGGATICLCKNAFIIGIYDDRKQYKYNGNELNCWAGICNKVIEEAANALLAQGY